MTSFAKAIYDNEAETEHELSFRRDDVIEVLEKDFNGVEGWWMCSVGGRTGMAPSNRLQMTKGENENPGDGNSFCKASTVVVGLRVDRDYDVPRGSTPPIAHPPPPPQPQGSRSRGRSCEDLLHPVDSPGVVDRRDGKTASGKQDCGGAAGKARRSGAGGSCDNLLFPYTGSMSNASSGVDVSRDYDTPASIAPGSSSRWKLHCEYSVSGKTGPEVRNENSIGFGQRSKQSEGQEVKVATSVVQPKTTDDFLERDSFLTDYDVPRSRRLLPPGDKITARNDFAGISPAQKGSKVKDFANRETTRQPVASGAVSSISNETTKTSCIADDKEFTNDLLEVRRAVDQVISHSNRWSRARNPETVQLIVRQACLSVWKKLQSLLTSFSKFLVKMRDPAVALGDQFGSLKVCAGRLEDLLTCIARCRPNEARPDFVKELDAVAHDIRTHVDSCSELITGSEDVYKAFTLPENAPNIFWRAPRSQGQVPPVPSTNQKTAFEKRNLVAGDYPLGVDRVQTMADVLSRRTNKQTTSNAATGVLPPAIIRDIPSPSSPSRPPQKSDVGFRRSERRHAADDVKMSRGAVVFGEERDCFRILERRCPNSPITPSKLVAQTSPSSSGLSPSDSVDYDLIRTRAEAEAEVATSRNAGPRGAASEAQADDRRTVELFYREQVVAVLRQLNATYRMVAEALGAGGGGSDGSSVSSGGLETEFRSLVVGFRRLGFICDALERGASSSEAVREKARSHSAALVSDTRAMTQTFASCVGAKWQPPVRRKLFLGRIEEMVRHSMLLAGILMTS